MSVLYVLLFMFAAVTAGHLLGRALHRASLVIDDALTSIDTYWPEDADHRWARIRETFSPSEFADLITWETEEDRESPALIEIDRTVLAGWRDMPYDQEADQ